MEALRLLQRRALQQLLKPRTTIQSSFRQIQYSTQPAFRTRPTTKHVKSAKFPNNQRISTRLLSNAFRPRTMIKRRFQSSVATGTSQEQLSLSQKMKKLSREYGWSAVGVYFLLSVLDFPFCFLFVKLVGTDRIGHWEHVIVSFVTSIIKVPMGGTGKEEVDEAAEKAEGQVKKNVTADDGQRVLEEEDSTYIFADHGYKDAEKANSGENASIWTQLALAYAIHKSFIFIRVPLTAAVTPKVVKTLRSWGWNIGKRPMKKSGTSAQVTGINTKGSGINTGK